RGHRILEVENNSIGPMQAGVDEIFRFVAGQVEARPAEPVFSRFPFHVFRFSSDSTRTRSVKRGTAFHFSSYRGLDARRDDERQRAHVINPEPCVFYSQLSKHFPRLRANAVAV